MDEQVEEQFKPPADGGEQVSPDGEIAGPSDEEIQEELTSENRNTFLFAVPGFVLQLATGSALLGFVGGILVIVGLMQYAKMKGRHRAWGLLGLLSIIGLLILYFVPPICRRCGEKNSSSNERCSNCNAPVSP